MPVSNGPLFSNLSMKSTVFFMACQSLSLPSSPSLILVRLVQFLNLVPIWSQQTSATNTHRHTIPPLYFHPPTVDDKTKKQANTFQHSLTHLREEFISPVRHQSIVGHDSPLLGGRLFMVSVFKSKHANGKHPVSLCN